MVYSIAEEFIRIFKSIDVEFNLGHWTSGFANESMFKVKSIGIDKNKFYRRSSFQLGATLDDIPNEMEFTFTHFMVPGIVLS